MTQIETVPKFTVWDLRAVILIDINSNNKRNQTKRINKYTNKQNKQTNKQTRQTNLNKQNKQNKTKQNETNQNKQTNNFRKHRPKP